MRAQRLQDIGSAVFFDMVNGIHEITSEHAMMVIVDGS
jgi:hypothetical protein